MLITGVLCLLAAVVAVAFGLRTLTRPATGDPEQQVLRAVAPAQVAAGAILGAGGAMVLVGPPAIGLLALIISVTGALGTLAAGAWQGARYAASQPIPVSGGCGGGCGCAGAAPEPAEPAEPAGCGGDCGCAGGGSAVDPALPATALPTTTLPFGLLPTGAEPVQVATVESAGCGDGCGCAGGAAAPAEPAGGCGSGCGCG